MKEEEILQLVQYRLEQAEEAVEGGREAFNMRKNKYGFDHVAK